VAKSHLRIVAPPTENRTVTPPRRRNADLRTREHLTAEEVERLSEAAKDNRYGHRDALTILSAFRHEKSAICAGNRYTSRPRHY
jgi:hypothetical protein